MSNRTAAAFFAWLLLVVAVTGVVVAQQIRPHGTHDGKTDPKGKETPNQEQAALDLQNRMVIGLVETFGRGITEPSTWLKEPQTGTASQRVYFLVLAGELAGPKEVNRYYAEFAPELEKDADPTWAEFGRVIDRLYDDYAHGRYEHPWLPEETREKVVNRLGWTGKLALAPAGGPNAEEREQLLESARRAFLTVAGVIVAGVGLFVLGLFGWFFVPVLIAFGKSRFGLPAEVPHHGVYVETFTLWMLVYGLFSLVAALLAPERLRLLLAGVGMLFSLVVLGWPVLRGVPWRQVRQDIGLTRGRRPFLEPLFGILVYTMTLYFVLFGALLSYLLIVLERGYSASGEGGGSPQDLRPNPIVEYMTNMDTWTWVQVFFAASVVAPIVEETMFRGVLYRHVRSAGRRLGSVLSVLVSALVVSFIFAIIHPQTLFAVPVLMALAIGFSLAREWRGTLIPPMIAHGLHNGLIVLIASQLLGS
jgi:membrane protease YdiL (CAAX protease family)